MVHTPGDWFSQTIFMHFEGLDSSFIEVSNIVNLTIEMLSRDKGCLKRFSGRYLHLRLHSELKFTHQMDVIKILQKNPPDIRLIGYVAPSFYHK